MEKSESVELHAADVEEGRRASITSTEYGVASALPTEAVVQEDLPSPAFSLGSSVGDEAGTPDLYGGDSTDTGDSECSFSTATTSLPASSGFTSPEVVFNPPLPLARSSFGRRRSGLEALARELGIDEQGQLKRSQGRLAMEAAKRLRIGLGLDEAVLDF